VSQVFGGGAQASEEAREVDAAEIDEALRRAVREALLRHKKLGNSIAVWRDGKVVIVPPEEIPA
jgi:hypothetical protein